MSIPDKDQVREALEWWDEDNPGKPWYMDPARELHEQRGKQDEWGRITTDAIVILHHVRDRIEPMHQLARAFVDGNLIPAEVDYEAAASWVRDLLADLNHQWDERFDADEIAKLIVDAALSAFQESGEK